MNIFAISLGSVIKSLLSSIFLGVALFLLRSSASVISFHRAKYYVTKVAHLKDCKQSTWWSEVKKLSGLSSASSSKGNPVYLFQHLGGGTSDGADLAKTIKEAFLSPLSTFEPLPKDYEPQPNDPPAVPYAVSFNSVFTKLLSLNPRKISGPDGIPSWLIKENADLLVGPITDIINFSFSEGMSPSIMESSRCSTYP